MNSAAANMMAFVIMYICAQFTCLVASFTMSPMMPHEIIVIMLNSSQFMVSRSEDIQYIWFSRKELWTSLRI